jgi:hypothetical protein
MSSRLRVDKEERIGEGEMSHRILIAWALIVCSAGAVFPQTAKNENGLEIAEPAGNSIIDSLFRQANLEGLQSPINEALMEIRELLPPEDQTKLDQITDELLRAPSDRLYRLEWSRDLCMSKLIECRGLSNDDVKPVVSGLLKRREIEATRLEATRTWITSIGSLLVSLGSLIVSFLAFRKRKGDEVGAIPNPSPSAGEKVGG